MKTAVACLVTALAVAGASFTLFNAHTAAASSTAKDDTIASLSRKVNSLTFSVGFLKQRLDQVTTTGAPGMYPSLPQLAREVFGIDIKVGNICRYNQLVESVTVFSGQVTTQTVKCN